MSSAELDPTVETGDTGNVHVTTGGSSGLGSGQGGGGGRFANSSGITEGKVFFVLKKMLSLLKCM